MFDCFGTAVCDVCGKGKSTDPYAQPYYIVCKECETAIGFAYEQRYGKVIGNLRKNLDKIMERFYR